MPQIDHSLSDRIIREASEMVGWTVPEGLDHEELHRWLFGSASLIRDSVAQQRAKDCIRAALVASRKDDMAECVKQLRGAQERGAEGASPPARR